MLQVNAIALDEDQFFATCSDDGSLRVWSVEDREQTLQFQVIEQVCIGYSIPANIQFVDDYHIRITSTENRV